MKKLNILITILYLTILIEGCRKNKNPISLAEELYSTSIIGEWEWLYSITHWPDFIIRNPISQGYTKTIFFTDNEQVKIFLNDTLHSNYYYSVTYIDSNAIESKGRLQISSWSVASFRIHDDSLSISEASTDGPVSYYLRIK